MQVKSRLQRFRESIRPACWRRRPALANFLRSYSLRLNVSGFVSASRRYPAHWSLALPDGSASRVASFSTNVSGLLFGSSQATVNRRNRFLHARARSKRQRAPRHADRGSEIPNLDAAPRNLARADRGNGPFEDKYFAQHPGVNPVPLLRAALHLRPFRPSARRRFDHHDATGASSLSSSHAHHSRESAANVARARARASLLEKRNCSKRI